MSSFADRTLRNITLDPDEELCEDIDGVDNADDVDVMEDECSREERTCAVKENRILEKKTESAAPQSIKTMATHFHNFILK